MFSETFLRGGEGEILGNFYEVSRNSSVFFLKFFSYASQIAFSTSRNEELENSEIL